MKKKLVIHTVTNNLTNGANNIRKLRKIVKCVRDLDIDNKVNIGFSNVMTRSDRNLGQEIRDLNLKLKRYCEGNNFLLVENVNVEELCLNNFTWPIKEQIFYVKISKIQFTIIEVLQQTAVKLIKLHNAIC